MRMRRIAWGLASALALAAGAGCRTTAPAWPVATLNIPRGGPAAEAFALPPAAVLDAGAGAIDDLGFRIEEAREQGAGRGRVDTLAARDDGGRTLTLSVRRDGRASRAEVSGSDPATARALLDRINARLGTRRTSPEPEPVEPADIPILSRSAVPDEVMLRDQALAGYRDTPTP